VANQQQGSLLFSMLVIHKRIINSSISKGQAKFPEEEAFNSDTTDKS
jgi:hypothetical protein